MAPKNTYTSTTLRFDLSEVSSSGCVLRRGRLSLKGREPIDTPHYLPPSSRGCVPHITQDTARSNTGIKGIYVALEDFLEKATDQDLPIYNTPAPLDQSRLRQFTALHRDALLVMGPRRQPPVQGRTANTDTSIAIQTSLGFSSLRSDDYVEAVQKLNPDIVLGLADYEYMKRPGVKRLEKMGDRTLSWTQDMLAGLRGDGDRSPGTALFAPILPIEAGQQSNYLDQLKEDLADQTSGIVLFDAASVNAIPAEMRSMPRLSLTEIRGPSGVLDQIALGLDIIVPSFVGEATDAGLALSFAFPISGRPANGQRLQLGINMWWKSYAADLTPIVDGCTCYTCSKHHRAFVRHLLDAKEMLAWVLLQMHNLHVMDVFFDGVRESIKSGMFESERDVFEESYERELPDGTGPGPR
ncbi:MAG: hypothetical protein LQ345_003347 [Seirophora villosa]|nr:MAG: hypothetical protein LQ345_003347 [Seirophora villosa]